MSGTKVLYLCGISHESASPSQIGECSVPQDKCSVRENFIFEKYGFAELVLLSTCNRVEYYFVASENFDCSQFCSDAFSNANGVCYVKKNLDVVEHLFEVASGLRSQMIGETEIFGQVKNAYSRAFDGGRCGSLLNSIFQKAAQVGKWIRTNTDIGHGKISIGSVSALLASQIFEDITAAEILLIGSGEAGRLIAEALLVRESRRLTIASRTRENAINLADALGVESDDFSSALSSLARYDIIICASAAGEIITVNMIKDALKKRSNPIFLIDLSVPKNVDEACSKIGDVFLYDMRDLSKIANDNMDLRKGEILRARQIIKKKALAVVSKLGMA